VEALVIKSTGSWITIRQDDGSDLDCKIKGTFRLKGIDSTNPVAVGDNVEYEVGVDGTGLITKIHERKNYIIRKSTKLSKRSHLLLLH